MLVVSRLLTRLRSALSSQITGEGFSDVPGPQMSSCAAQQCCLASLACILCRRLGSARRDLSIGAASRQTAGAQCPRDASARLPTSRWPNTVSGRTETVMSDGGVFSYLAWACKWLDAPHWRGAKRRGERGACRSCIVRPMSHV